MKYSESAVIYNKMKGNLTDEAMRLIGITKEKIDKAMHQCVSSGMSRKVAVRTVCGLWKNADPDVQIVPATAKEMDLMGFLLKDNIWTHSKYLEVKVTTEEQKTKSFKEIEQLVLSKHENTY